MSGQQEICAPLENLSFGTHDSSGSHSYSFSSSHSDSNRESHSDGSHKGSDKSSGYNHVVYADNSGLTGTQSGGQSGYETMDTRMSDEYLYGDRFKRLPELEQVPWTDREVLLTLQKGRAKELSGNISLELLQRLSYLLQRALVRITKEAQRLSASFCKCTKHDIQAAIKIILTRKLADSCTNACFKAGALYSMSGDNFKQSKSARCGLHFSIGRFQRWMIDAQIALRIQEMAAVYLTACMENLLEETVLLTLGKEPLGDVVLGANALDFTLSSVTELWGLYQPWEHLICGRNASGMISLPSTLSMASLVSSSSAESRTRSHKRHERADSVLAKSLEQSLMATCVGSLSELGDLICQSMHHWYNKTSASKSQLMVTWGPNALRTLCHYMKCSQLEHADNPNVTPPSIHLHNDRPYVHQPPLLEWIRVATAHAEYRLSLVVDSDDVRQAARLLLPDVDCPPREFSTDESLCASRHLDAETCAQRFQEDVAFRMLACGRSDIVPQALMLLGGKEKVNTISQQGLTPLMYACMRGDEAMVHILIDAGAALDIVVPCSLQQYPSIHPEIRQWTALHFAVVHGHISVVQLLLESGANVEGAADLSEENYAETPLQLSAAAGHYELVSLLLTHGADPYLTTYNRNGLSYSAPTQGSYNAFCLAASHGQRNVLSKLLTNPVKPKSSDFLSLEEILAEGSLTNGNQESADDNRVEQLHFKAEQVPSHISDYENDYVTIDDVIYEDIKLNNNLSCHRTSHFSKGQLKSLQEALYNSAENGYLDIALELRAMGIQWTVHTWCQSVYTAHATRRKAIVQCLLKDFNCVRYDDNKTEFLEECLPLLFDIFRHSKNEIVGEQLASIFARLYGKAPLPIIQEIPPIGQTLIDPHYVNNPEMADIQFIIEGKVFYAHKIILVNASNRFKTMLSKKFCSDDGQPVIEINDISFHIFELVMQFLYSGNSTAGLKVDQKNVFELLGAANFFLLEGLQRHCEVLLSQRLTVDNCSAIYKHAKLFGADELVTYCEGFFLQNLLPLVKSNDAFRKLVFTKKSEGQNLTNGMLGALTRRLEAKVNYIRSSRV